MRRSVRFAVAGALVALAPVLAIPTSGAASTQGFWVAQFGARITDASRAALTGTGMQVIDYLPEDSYIVWGDESQAKAAARLGPIVALKPFAPTDKIGLGAETSGYLDLGVYGPKLGQALAALGGLGVVERHWMSRPDGLIATVRMSAPAAAEIARRPEVLYVNPSSPTPQLEDEATDQTQAGNFAGSLPATGYRAWLASKGLDGSGVRVAIVDTGISPLHPDFYRLDGTSRIAVSYSYGPVPFGLDDGGHGTHVAGIVGGNPQPVGTFDTSLFEWGLGVAPGVELVRQNALGFGVPFPPSGGFSTYSRDALLAGAHIWNSSWNTGEGARIGYTSSTREMDVISRNANFSTPGSEEFLLVFSAGNAGTAGPTTPHEAKNIIAVGATNSGRASNTGLLTGAGMNSVASFSSIGNTRDGRIFPTIVAPGGNVVSARGPESTLLCVPPIGGAPLYYSCSGTSMSAPHAAGAAALIHQWWKLGHGGALPSPAMVKALMVNNATDLPGNSSIPNRSEGWGRINLSNVFDATPSMYADQATVFGGPGETSVTNLTVADTSKPLKITIAWGDAPGVPCTGSLCGPALVNDLDLLVERLDGAGNPVQTWRGNNFLTGMSIEGGAEDRRNNLENVYVAAPAAGTYRITVSAFNVPGDGIPENGDTTDQDFALVIRNAVIP